MPGPPPKHPGVRRRRNRASTTAVLRPEARITRRPSLRARATGGPSPERPWHPATVQWWETIWQSPQVDEWLEADVPSALFIWAELMDQFHYDPDPKLAAELRQHRRDMGFTPLDRRRLGYQITRPDDGEQQSRRRSSSSRRRRHDPRKVLQILEGGKK
jgi:hypothetical protein